MLNGKFAKFFKKDLTNLTENGIIARYENEVWLSLVERYVRDTMTISLGSPTRNCRNALKTLTFSALSMPLKIPNSEA